MKALIVGFQTAGPNCGAVTEVWDGTGTFIGDFNLPITLSYSDSSPSDYWSDISSSCIAQLALNGVTILASDIVFLAPLLSSLARTYNYPSLAVNTARQPSVTQDTFVSASVAVTATLSLVTGQQGTVTLQYADNSGFTTNLVTVQPATDGNTGSLSIGLNLGQIVTSTVTGIIPAGKYYRLLTTNVTGTPTYGTPVIQEVLL